MFEDLNRRVIEINRAREMDGLLKVAKSQVRLLGQMSLMSQKEVSATLSLTQTGAVDALLTMDHLIQKEFKNLLLEHGLVYDEDSYLIWIPPGANFRGLFRFENIEVDVIDPESALVSKAVKAPQKNKQLIREAIASGQFATLVDRILKNGGRIESFL